MIKYEIIYVYLILDNVYMIYMYYINLNNVKLFVWVSLWNEYIYIIF